MNTSRPLAYTGKPWSKTFINNSIQFEYFGCIHTQCIILIAQVKYNIGNMSWVCKILGHVKIKCGSEISFPWVWRSHEWKYRFYEMEKQSWKIQITIEITNMWKSSTIMWKFATESLVVWALPILLYSTKQA